MTDALRSRATLVWLLLIAVTLLSWWLGFEQAGDAVEATRAATVAVLLLAFFKVRMIVSVFMEVRHAPWPLRRICDAWMVLVLVVMLGLYAWGTGA